MASVSSHVRPSPSNPMDSLDILNFIPYSVPIGYLCLFTRGSVIEGWTALDGAGGRPDLSCFLPESMRESMALYMNGYDEFLRLNPAWSLHGRILP